MPIRRATAGRGASGVAIVVAVRDRIVDGFDIRSTGCSGIEFKPLKLIAVFYWHDLCFAIGKDGLCEVPSEIAGRNFS